MKILNITCLACAAGLMAACDGSDDVSTGVPFIIGPGATLAEANAEVVDTIITVENIEFDDGTTFYSDLPGGTASYTGVIYGDVGDLEHAADLKLNATFNTNALSGRIENVVTNVPNFENPTGTVQLTGVIIDGTPEARLQFFGSDLLTGSNGVSANWEVLDANGDFVGLDGEAVIGTQLTDVIWESGPNDGFIFESDGGFAAIRD